MIRMESICEKTPPHLVAAFGEEKNFFLDVLYGVCRQLWFDFDSLPCLGSSSPSSPSSSFSPQPWSVVKSTIEEKSKILDETAMIYLDLLEKNPENHTSHFNSFLSRLQSEGLLG